MRHFQMRESCMPTSKVNNFGDIYPKLRLLEGSYLEIIWAFERPLRHFWAMLVLKNVKQMPTHPFIFVFIPITTETRAIAAEQGAQKQQKPKGRRGGRTLTQC